MSNPLPVEPPARSWYGTLAIVVVNSLVLFALLNLAAWAVEPVRAKWRSTRELQKIQADARLYKKILPGMSPKEIFDLRQEFMVPARFDPTTLFRQAARRGHYVNVDSTGFRHVADQGPWPLDSAGVNVFVFGGSTLFGWGVPDDATIPSALQRHLNTLACARQFHVYNFGQPAFYSTQERQLLEELLLEGARPQIAIFVDGMNDADIIPRDAPRYAHDFDALFRSVQTHRLHRSVGAAMLYELPAISIAGSLARRLLPPPASETNPFATDPTLPRQIVERWQRNRSLIEGVAATQGIRTMFVWQPVPGWKYDERLHPRRDARDQEAVPVSELMSALHQKGKLPGVLWLHDMQENLRDTLYVDDVHYTGAFSATIADSIGAEMELRGLACARPQAGRTP